MPLHDLSVPPLCNEDLQTILSRTSAHSTIHNIKELAAYRGEQLQSEPALRTDAPYIGSLIRLGETLISQPSALRDVDTLVNAKGANTLVAVANWLAKAVIEIHYVAAQLGIPLEDVQNGVIADMLNGSTDHRAVVATMMFGVNPVCTHTLPEV